MCTVESDLRKTVLLKKKSALILSIPALETPGRAHQFTEIQSKLNDRSLCLDATNTFSGPL